MKSCMEVLWNLLIKKIKKSYGIQLPNLPFYMVFKNKNKKSFQTLIWAFCGFLPMVCSLGFIMLETYGWKFWLPMAARNFFSFLCLLDAKTTSFNVHVNKHAKIDKRGKLDRNKLGNLSRASLRGFVNLGFSVLNKKFRTKNWLGSKDFLLLFDRENVGLWGFD